MSNKCRKSKKKIDENKTINGVLIPEFDPYVSGHRLFIIKTPKFLEDILKGGSKYGNITRKH